jgi:hypothetical protein
MKILALAVLVAGLPGLAQSGPGPTAVPEPAGPPAEPFTFADFTWLNGNPRTKDAILDTKYFTGEFRADANLVYDFNHPQDHTLVGSS